MKFDILWDEILLLSFVKKSNMYIAQPNIEGLEQAQKTGFMVSSLENIPIISYSIPIIIAKRIPEKSLANKMLGNDIEDEETRVVEFIKKFNCKYITDKIRVEVRS